MNTTKDFVSITDLSAKEILHILKAARAIKEVYFRTGHVDRALKNASLVMIFEKPSLRTRLSFESGMTKLGGHAVYLGPGDINMGSRESVPDIARVAASMSNIIMARTFKHQSVEKLAKYANVPVINGLSDLEHPCQILADFMTMQEIKGDLSKLKIAYIGDGENNIPHSLCLGAAVLGASFFCASPIGYWMKPKVAAQAKAIAVISGAKVVETANAQAAVEDVDVVYTDTFVSMGDENERNARLNALMPYQVTKGLMTKAKPDAIFMHDLPAYRGYEVTSAVIDGPQSVVFQQAENRMWVQMALMTYLSQQPSKIAPGDYTHGN